MPKNKNAQKIAKLLEQGKKDMSIGGPGKVNVPYAYLKREGDRQLMVTKDKDRYYAKKNLDKKIESLESEISLNILPNAVQEGNTRAQADKLYKKADEMKKELNSLKEARKKLK